MPIAVLKVHGISYIRLIELSFNLVRFSLGSWPMACGYPFVVVLHAIIVICFHFVGACSIVVFEFERSASTYFGSWRVELVCASLGMPN